VIDVAFNGKYFMGEATDPLGFGGVAVLFVGVAIDRLLSSGPRANEKSDQWLLLRHE